MNITLHAAASDPARAGETLVKDLGFGKYFADLMFTMRYSPAQGWHQAEIRPYGPLSLDPAAMVFHYGQEIFEGQKAYKWEDSSIAMFRPDANAARLNRSAQRLCMPQIPVEDQVEATFTLVSMLHEWIPAAPSALYVRPTMVAVEPALGVRAATEYLYFIICSPVGPYFPEKEFPYDPAKPTVKLLGTGGTIASRLDYRTGAVIPAFTPGELYGSVPELADICNLETEKLYGVFSENMGPEQWIGTAQAIGREIAKGVQGIVVGHGTDTMHHTAAILSFMVQKCSLLWNTVSSMMET